MPRLLADMDLAWMAKRLVSIKCSISAVRNFCRTFLLDFASSILTPLISWSDKLNRTQPA
ncbi:TPA: hypothetical protein DEP86_03635 [Candidatus Uhrbacteria bacterium]|nr:hypothetical protein [Candidatus Uhrbacteria bacterium]